MKKRTMQDLSTFSAFLFEEKGITPTVAEVDKCWTKFIAEKSKNSEFTTSEDQVLYNTLRKTAEDRK